MNGMSILLQRGTGTFGGPSIGPGWDLKYYETCTNFTYVNANSFTCTSAYSQTTSGSLTAQTNAYGNSPAINLTVPANSMGANGFIHTRVMMSSDGGSSSGGDHDKTVRISWAPTDVYSSISLPWVVDSSMVNGTNLTVLDCVIHNCNSAAKQVVKQSSMAPGVPTYSTGGQPAARYTVDTTADQLLCIGVGLASGDSWAIIEYADVEIFHAS